MSTGVVSAVSGYAGGAAATAHYDMTSQGDTGHAESVEIAFDPAKISYGKLLQIYFSVAHDPTELNRQGPDEGTQYRSAIFPTSAAQAEVAKAYIAAAERGAHVRRAGRHDHRAGQDLLSAPRPIIRTFSRRIRPTRTSCSTTCRRSRR